jgi:hypothetical protein
VTLAPSVQSRQAGYRGMSSRWHPAMRCPQAGSRAVVLALALAGCSFSYQLDNVFTKKDEDRTDQSAALRLAIPKPAAQAPAEADLVIARAAVSEILTKGGKDASMPWENPKTGARGTITPLAPAYSEGGVTCRDFLASYVKNGTESWLQGAACRAGRGTWEVRDLRPWKNT